MGRNQNANRACPPIGSGGWAFGVFLCVLVALIGDASGFDFSRYRPRMIKELIADFKARKGLVITRDVPIRSKATYSGEFRDLHVDSSRLIAAWAGSMNVPGLPQAFRRELKIVEAEREYWVPVQNVLVSSMKTELRPSEEIELFMIYIGQVDGRHIFLVNEFGHESPH